MCIMVRCDISYSPREQDRVPYSNMRITVVVGSV